jgi:hypothetical protein
VQARRDCTTGGLTFQNAPVIVIGAFLFEPR